MAGARLHLKYCPRCISSFSSEPDLLFPVESRRKAEDILVKNKASYHIQIFSGVSHGFAVRADLSDENASTCLHVVDCWVAINKSPFIRVG